MSESEGEELRESNPNAAGPRTGAGAMGVSSERSGDAGPFDDVTTGVKDTTVDRGADNDDVPPEQRPGGEETNPDGLEPKAGYPEKDPRSDG